MAGGVLTGKYETGQTGRAAAEIDDPRLAAARRLGARVRALAAELGTSPAALAIAFALANPAVASVLFGATSPAQIDENTAALDSIAPRSATAGDLSAWTCSTGPPAPTPRSTSRPRTRCSASSPRVASVRC